ncbi:MAG TPA: CIA30 family protein [Dokdonella sp.]|uniref:CIA30 family protein n=1 Tax=Dokdonella sp. TaxID=2291710 RepID=UPI002D809E2A|nr:CIA30 family protein [Dokdonella sp.]HET9034056.1 CIA30 family protein [Dokdonella sp.]
MQTLFDFQSAASASHWVAVNDVVMGGESLGRVEITGGKLRFSGSLSLANNGGFASARAREQHFDFSDFRHVLMRVRGDGRHYQLRLATDARHRGITVSYGAPFATTAGEWIIVRIGLDSLTASVRGTSLDGPPLDVSSIREIGLLINDKAAGSFSLEVDWIAVE